MTDTQKFLTQLLDEDVILIYGYCYVCDFNVEQTTYSIITTLTNDAEDEEIIKNIDRQVCELFDDLDFVGEIDFVLLVVYDTDSKKWVIKDYVGKSADGKYHSEGVC